MAGGYLSPGQPNTEPKRASQTNPASSSTTTVEFLLTVWKLLSA